MSTQCLAHNRSHMEPHGVNSRRKARSASAREGRHGVDPYDPPGTRQNSRPSISRMMECWPASPLSTKRSVAAPRPAKRARADVADGESPDEQTVVIRAGLIPHRPTLGPTRCRIVPRGGNPCMVAENARAVVRCGGPRYDGRHLVWRCPAGVRAE